MEEHELLNVFDALPIVVLEDRDGLFAPVEAASLEPVERFVETHDRAPVLGPAALVPPFWWPKIRRQLNVDGLVALQVCLQVRGLDVAREDAVARVHDTPSHHESH